MISPLCARDTSARAVQSARRSSPTNVQDIGEVSAPEADYSAGSGALLGARTSSGVPSTRHSEGYLRPPKLRLQYSLVVPTALRKRRILPAHGVVMIPA